MVVLPSVTKVEPLVAKTIFSHLTKTRGHKLEKMTLFSLFTTSHSVIGPLLTFWLELTFPLTKIWLDITRASNVYFSHSHSHWKSLKNIFYTKIIKACLGNFWYKKWSPDHISPLGKAFCPKILILEHFSILSWIWKLCCHLGSAIVVDPLVSSPTTSSLRQLFYDPRTCGL